MQSKCFPKLSFILSVIFFCIAALLLSSCSSTNREDYVGSSRFIDGTVDPSRKKDEELILKRQQEVIRRQQLELERQEREAEDLKRQRYLNRELKVYQ
jgi:membrane protein involved in colicin uptake